MSEYPSQIGQDRFVVEILQGKRHGTFMDLGAHFPRATSNTWHLEKILGWRGLAVDCDASFCAGWQAERPQSVFIQADALALDYAKLLQIHGMTMPVDYLSLDLEPPEDTWRCLQHVMTGGMQFRVVTFETDFYRYQASREPSRRLMQERGYVLARPGVCGQFGEQDDFYFHPDLC